MINWQANSYPKTFMQGTGYKQRKLNPPLILTCGFMVLIIIGTGLLLTPLASTQPLSIMQAMFTATSAVTVTGLVVIDTGTALTAFGQTVVMVLIQIGGIGFMTVAVISLLSLGKTLGLQQRY